eukprot:4260268-Lingulodinium_polyedra.AAC.1
MPGAASGGPLRLVGQVPEPRRRVPGLPEPVEAFYPSARSKAAQVAKHPSPSVARGRLPAFGRCNARCGRGAQ